MYLVVYYWKVFENCRLGGRSSHSVIIFFILQAQLYEDFAKSQVKRGLEETVSHIDEENKSEKASKDNPHVLQVSIDFSLTPIRQISF